MNGTIDELLRTLLPLNVRSSPSSELQNVTAWIDTAFIGQLVFPRQLVEQMGLEQYAATDAILADGSKVTLESFVGYLNWFGSEIVVQVVASDCKLPLLGTELLADRVLHIDYAKRELTLD